MMTLTEGLDVEEDPHRSFLMASLLTANTPLLQQRLDGRPVSTRYSVECSGLAPVESHSQPYIL